METSTRNAEIAQRVIVLAAEQTDVDPSTVTPATHFTNDLNWDSLDYVEFQMALEDEFEFSLPDEDAVDLWTIEKVVTYVLAHTPVPADANVPPPTTTS